MSYRKILTHVQTLSIVASIIPSGNNPSNTNKTTHLQIKLSKGTAGVVIVMIERLKRLLKLVKIHS
jgi:hypothetical protein